MGVQPQGQLEQLQRELRCCLDAYDEKLQQLLHVSVQQQQHQRQKQQPGMQGRRVTGVADEPLARDCASPGRRADVLLLLLLSFAAAAGQELEDLRQTP